MMLEMEIKRFNATIGDMTNLKKDLRLAGYNVQQLPKDAPFSKILIITKEKE